MLFGLALSPPLPIVEERNITAKIPIVRNRQTMLHRLNFQVSVDNLALAHPLCLPSDRQGHTASQCEVGAASEISFKLIDGPVAERCTVKQHRVSVEGSNERFNVYELRYENDRVAGNRLSFSGYLFQQTGRLYPRDIQGILIRLGNVAIGKYDNSMLTYPYAEGPRYAMVSSELFIEDGFEDALNIDRDSFNELHPHYIRVQSYVHGLLHDVIFPETWGEEKQRNKKRREEESSERDARFVRSFRDVTGEPIRSIRAVEREAPETSAQARTISPVEFELPRGRVEIDYTHPLLQPLLKRRKYESLVQKLVVAFERANNEANAGRRREMFYRLLTEIFENL
jgi:hypothetical protein